MTINESLVEKFKEKNPSVELFKLEHKGEEFVLRRPSRAMFKTFMHKLANPKDFNSIETGEELLNACIVSPSRIELDDLFEKDLLLSSHLSSKFVNTVTNEEEANQKKL